MRRNEAKAKFLETLYSEAMAASNEDWGKAKERVFTELTSLFRPGLLTDIARTLKTFLGTARWYSQHNLTQFSEYSDFVRREELQKLDLGSTILLDVSRIMDVWAGHQLTQVRHLVVASTKYEKVFDLPIWGNRISQFLDGSNRYLSGGLFDRQLLKYNAPTNRTFLKLNRVYESSHTRECGSVDLWSMSFLLYRIQDFLRIIRAGRLEFLVKEPQYLRAPSLCLYGIMTGTACEYKPEANASGFIKIGLRDSSSEQVFFYLLPEDYSNLLSATNLSTLNNSTLAVLARCRFSAHAFNSPAEIVPRRIWIISDSDFAKAQAISDVRLRLRIHPSSQNMKVYDGLVSESYAHKLNGFYEYTPRDGLLVSIVESNAFFQKVDKGISVEDIATDLRHIGQSLREPAITPVRPRTDLELAINLVLRAFYPNELTIGKLGDWINYVVGDPLALNPQAHTALLLGATERLTMSNRDVILFDRTKIGLRKCTPLSINDDLLTRYLYLLISVHQSLRIDTLLSKTSRSLGLDRNEEDHLRLLIDKLVDDDRVSVTKNKIMIPGMPPENIELEDRHESIDNALINVLHGRKDTFTERDQLFDSAKAIIRDLTSDDVSGFLEQHLHSDIVKEFGRYAIVLPPQEAAERRRQFIKKHFAPVLPKPDIGELETIILTNLHRASPSKCTLATISEDLIRLIPAASRRDMSMALHNLCNKRVVLVDKTGRYMENPSPPHFGAKKAVPREPTSLTLNNQQVLMLASLARAHQAGKVFFIDKSGTRKAFVRTFQESEQVVTDLLKKMEEGRIFELWYEDHLGAMVKVQSQGGTITGTYDGPPSAVMRLREAISKGNNQ